MTMSPLPWDSGGEASRAVLKGMGVAGVWPLGRGGWCPILASNIRMSEAVLSMAGGPGMVHAQGDPSLASLWWTKGMANSACGAVAAAVHGTT